MYWPYNLLTKPLQENDAEIWKIGTSPNAFNSWSVLYIYTITQTTLRWRSRYVKAIAWNEPNSFTWLKLLNKIRLGFGFGFQLLFRALRLFTRLFRSDKGWKFYRLFISDKLNTFFLFQPTAFIYCNFFNL